MFLNLKSNYFSLMLLDISFEQAKTIAEKIGFSVDCVDKVCLLNEWPQIVGVVYCVCPVGS